MKSKYRTENAGYWGLFRRQFWIVAIVVVGVSIGLAVLGEYWLVGLLVTVGVAYYAYMLWAYQSLLQSFSKALTEPRPDRALGIISRFRGENAKGAVQAYMAAQVYLVYGQYEDSERILGEFDWTKTSPYNESKDRLIRSIIAYVQGSSEVAAELAEEASELAELPGTWNTVRRSRLSYELLLALTAQRPLNEREESCLENAVSESRRMVPMEAMIYLWLAETVLRANARSHESQQCGEERQKRAPFGKGLPSGDPLILPAAG